MLINLGIVKTPSKKVYLRLEPVQQQVGGADCGVFAIANLVEVLCGKDPRQAQFNQDRMREHLFRCISLQAFTPFPKTEKLAPTKVTRDHMRSFRVSFLIACFSMDVYQH